MDEVNYVQRKHAKILEKTHCPKTTADSSDAEDLVNEPTSDAVASINVVQVSTSSNAEDPVITSKEKKNKVKLQNSVKSFFMKK